MNLQLGSHGFGRTRKLLGKVLVSLDLNKPAGESKGGWVDFGRKGCGGGEVHVSVRTEPDCSWTVSIMNGGKFTLNTTTSVSPASSPRIIMDLGSTSWLGSGSDPETGIWSHLTPGGFVMSAAMGGVDEQVVGPKMEAVLQNVTCTEDAAAFVALAAALDLSIDACRLFSHKLRTELRQQSQE